MLVEGDYGSVEVDDEVARTLRPRPDAINSGAELERIIRCALQGCMTDNSVPHRMAIAALTAQSIKDLTGRIWL